MLLPPISAASESSNVGLPIVRHVGKLSRVAMRARQRASLSKGGLSNSIGSLTIANESDDSIQLQSVLMDLHVSVLEEMRKDWIQMGDFVSEEQFSSLISPRLSTQFHQSIPQLFSELDADCERSITWQHFADYLLNLDSRLSSSAVDYSNNGAIFTERKIKCTRKNFTDDIKKVSYFAGIRKVVGTCSTKLKIIHPTTFEVERKVNLQADGKILSVSHVPSVNGEGMLLVGCSDMTVHSLSDNNYRHLSITRLTTSATCIKYLRNTVLIGTRDGRVYASAPHFFTESSNVDLSKNPNVTVAKLHTDSVTDATLLRKGGLVTSSYDTNIKVIDAVSLVDILTLSGQHRKGVYCLSVNTEYGLLVSAGADSTPLCWAAEGGNSISPSPLRDTTAPHRGTITGVYCLPESPQVISCDERYNFKVWDLRMYLPVQSFSPHNLCRRGSRRKSTGFCYISETSTILSHTEKFISWSTTPCDTGLSSITSTVVVPKTERILVASSNSIVVYNLRTAGKISQFTTSDKSEITVVAVCQTTGRKIYVAHSNTITLFVIPSGVQLRDIKYGNERQRGDGTFTHMALVSATKKIVACCFTGDVVVFSDGNMLKVEKVFSNIHSGLVRSISTLDGRLYTTDGTVILGWCEQLSTVQSKLSLGGGQTITSIALSPTMIYTVDSVGTFEVFLLAQRNYTDSQSQNKSGNGNCLCTWKYSDYGMADRCRRRRSRRRSTTTCVPQTDLGTSIVELSHDLNSDLLCSLDESGTVTTWKLTTSSEPSQDFTFKVMIESWFTPDQSQSWSGLSCISTIGSIVVWSVEGSVVFHDLSGQLIGTFNKNTNLVSDWSVITRDITDMRSSSLSASFEPDFLTASKYLNSALRNRGSARPVSCSSQNSLSTIPSITQNIPSRCPSVQSLSVCEPCGLDYLFPSSPEENAMFLPALL